MDINEWGCFSHNIQVVMWFQLKEAWQQSPAMPTEGGSSCICRQAASNMRRDREYKGRLGLWEGEALESLLAQWGETKLD